MIPLYSSITLSFWSISDWSMCFCFSNWVNSSYNSSILLNFSFIYSMFAYNWFIWTLYFCISSSSSFCWSFVSSLATFSGTRSDFAEFQNSSFCSFNNRFLTFSFRFDISSAYLLMVFSKAAFSPVYGCAPSTTFCCFNIVIYYYDCYKLEPPNILVSALYSIFCSSPLSMEAYFTFIWFLLYVCISLICSFYCWHSSSICSISCSFSKLVFCNWKQSPCRLFTLTWSCSTIWMSAGSASACDFIVSRPDATRLEVIALFFFPRLLWGVSDTWKTAVLSTFCIS